MFLNIFLYVLHLYGQDKLRNKLVEMVAYLWLKSRAHPDAPQILILNFQYIQYKISYLF